MSDKPIEKMTDEEIKTDMRRMETVRKLRLPSTARQTINHAEYDKYKSAVETFLGSEQPACAESQHNYQPYFDMLRCTICLRIKT